VGPGRREISMALLKATKRTELGSRNARRLRGKGEIPGVIYGHGEEVVSITLPEHDVEMAVLRGKRLLEVQIGQKKENVLVKEVQYDTFGQEILHIDLARVSLDERVEVTVPIVLRGIPAGAAEGGVLQQAAAKVTVECVVTAIPDEIRISVAEMKVGNLRHMKDLPLPEGTRLLSDPEAVVCSVSFVAEVEVAGPAEAVAAAEPEVIGEKKEEEEEKEEAKEAEERPEKKE